jgi:hypothetical protein
MSKVYPLAKLQKKVVGDNVTDVWHIQVNAYGKRVKDSGSQAWVASNDYVCATLGTLLGLPIPPFAMLEKRSATARESLWFASLSYLKEGEDLPPVIPSVAYANLPEICAGVVIFDLWVANTDRHDRNLSFDPNTSPKRLNVFDHSHALFGIEGPARLTRMMNKFTLVETAETGAFRHSLMDQLDDPECFTNWLNRIGSIPQFQISDACRNAESMGIIDADERRLLLEFLLRRRRFLREMIVSNFREFTKITLPPLF